MAAVSRETNWEKLLTKSPFLVEEARGYDLSRPTLVGRRSGVHHRIIRKLRDLPRVVQVIEFAEGESAVENDILFRIQRIRIDQDRRVAFGRKSLGSNGQSFRR